MFVVMELSEKIQYMILFDITHYNIVDTVVQFDRSSARCPVRCFQFMVSCYDFFSVQCSFRHIIVYIEN